MDLKIPLSKQSPLHLFRALCKHAIRVSFSAGGTPRHNPAPAASREQTNPSFAQADGQMPNGLCVHRTSGSLQGAGLMNSCGGSGERHLLPILKLGVGEK